jgi:hypothetical protein
MAAIKSLRLVSMKLDDTPVAGSTFEVIFQGDPDNYPTPIATAMGATIKEATGADLGLALDIVTPVASLLKSGNFVRLTARGGKKSRQLIVPSTKVSAVTALIRGSAPTGTDINGAMCTSVSNGLKRRTI